MTEDRKAEKQTEYENEERSGDDKQKKNSGDIRRPLWEEQGNVISDKVYRNARKRAERRSKAIKFSSLAIGLLLSAAIVLVCGYFYLRVDTIEVEGNKVYSEEEIISKCGVVIGENILKVNSSTVASALGKKLPFVYSVKVERTFPNKVHIRIFEEEPYFYFRAVNQFVVVSSDLKVLKIFTDEEELLGIFPSLACVQIPDVLYAVVGQKIRLFDSQNAEFIISLIEEIDSSQISDRITAVDASNRFDLRITYANRFEIQLGNTRDLASKLLFAEHIINSFTEDTKGTICVENVSSGYAIVDYPSHLIVSE